MQDLITLFDISTGLYSVYKWCRIKGIPKELFNLIFTCYKHCGKCIHCSIGCCDYRVRGKHKNSNISLRSLVGSLIDMHKWNPQDNSIIGKIVCIAVTKNAATKIPFNIEVVLNSVIDMNPTFYVGHRTYATDIIDFSYDIVFNLIGCIFSRFTQVTNYPAKYGRGDIKGYLTKIKTECFALLYKRGSIKNDIWINLFLLIKQIHEYGLGC